MLIVPGAVKAIVIVLRSYIVYHANRMSYGFLDTMCHATYVKIPAVFTSCGRHLLPVPDKFEFRRMGGILLLQEVVVNT